MTDCTKKFEIKVPANLMLYEFQRETVLRSLHFLCQNSTHACYCASEQGLGKSITAIVTANSISCLRVLLVVPAVMRRTWKQEIDKWSHLQPSSYDTVAVIESASDLTDAALRAKWIIVSYALLASREVVSKLCSQTYSLLILDEAHAIKNLKAKRTRVCVRELFPKCYAKLLLSGTPMTRQVTDLYVPLKACMPQAFGSFYEFANRYAYSRKTPWTTEYYGLRNAEELSSIMRNNFYIRYKKETVLKELPPKTYQRILLSHEYAIEPGNGLYEEQQKVLQALMEDKGFKVPSCVAEYRHAQGLMKVAPVAEFAVELLEQEIPLVIFGWHTAVIKALKEKLAKYKPVMIIGETSSDEREKAIALFQNKATLCFLGNIQAAGTGITLTASSTVLLAELDWSPANIAQACDRVHRIGQKENVLIYTFSVEDSFDETVERVVMQKTKVFNATCDRET